MRQTNFGLLICLTLTLSQFASAATGSKGAGSSGNWYFEETLLPVYVNKTEYRPEATTKSVATETGLGYDLRSTLGYIAWDSVLFGLTYNLYSVNTTRPRTADWEGLKTSTSKSEFGPTVGYMINDWRFLLTYFLSASKAYHETYTDPVTGANTTDDSYKYSAGSGYQISIQYGLELGAGFSIGPTLIYRAVTYKKQSLDSSSSTYGPTNTVSAHVDSELKPMITLSLRFL